jgi:hypothetical protein
MRKALIISGVWAFCYVSSYVTLSLTGAYIPDWYNVAGIHWRWAPKFDPWDAPNLPARYRSDTWERLFLPLIWLDSRYWHKDPEAKSGPRKINGAPYYGN